MKTIKSLLVAFFLLNAGLTISQTGWFTLQPGTTNWIISVKFLNENTGFAAGWGGYISKTTGEPIGFRLLQMQLQVINRLFF